MTGVEETSVPVIAVTAAVGAVVLLFVLFCNVAKKQSDESDKSEENENGETQEVTTEKSQQTKKKERAPPKRKDTKPTFSHPWLASTLKNHSCPVLGLDFSPNGKYLASWAEDRSVLIWYTKQFNQKEHKAVRGNVELDYCTKIKFSPDSRAFIGSLYRENNVRVFKMGKKDDGSVGNIQTGFDFPQKFDTELLNVGISITGKYIMTAYADTTVRVWDLRGELLATVNTNNMGNSHVAVSPCGRFFAASGFTPDVKVWLVQFDKGGGFKEVVRAFELKGHTSGVYSFSFSAGSTRMATVSKDGTWKLWNTDIEYEKQQDPGLLTTGSYPHTGHALAALSPDGRTLALSQELDIHIYNALNGQPQQIFTQVHSMAVSALEFDLSGKYLLSTGDKHIHVFHNIAGYKITVQDLEEQLQKANSAALKERLKDQLKDAKLTLKSFSELDS